MHSPEDRFYIVEIQYLGFRYHGFQKQPEVKTIQGMLERTIKYVLGHDNFKTLSAGRTDAMVSANQAVFELFLKQNIDTSKFLNDLKINLPPDIRPRSVNQTDHTFNIIQSAKRKQYLYFFTDDQNMHPFAAPFMAAVNEKLDIDKMKECAILFEGEHDFRRFCYKPNDKTNFRRKITKCEITENTVYTANFFPERSFVLKVEGAGFLRNQVRLMAAALINVGKHKFTKEDIIESLTGNKDDMICEIAPASGLILQKVSFEES